MRNALVAAGLWTALSCGGHTTAPTRPPPPALAASPPQAHDPLDLDFEAPLDPAVWTTRPVPDAATVDATVAHGGKQSQLLHLTAGGGAFVASRALVPIDTVRGHRVQISGWLRTRDVAAGYGGMWYRIDGADGRVLAADTMSDRGLAGTQDWTRVELSLAVPPAAAQVSFGAILIGHGDVWLDDAAIDVGAPLSQEEYEGPVPVEGVVIDAAQKPLAGLTVRASMTTDDRPVLVGEAVVTGEDGRFRIAVPTGAIGVAATSPTIAAGLVSLTVSRAQPVSGVRLVAGGAGRVLSGRVRDLDGAPVTGALAGASHVLPDGTFLLLLVEAAPDGEYRLVLPEGRYGPLALGADGLSVPPTSIDLAADQRVDVTLARRSQLARPAPPAVRTWLARAAAPLATVEAGHGFADLEPVGRMVGAARLVGLGEATHGTLEFSQMKHRMLEYLVTKRGFSVFILEGGFAEVMRVNDYVVDGKGTAKVAMSGFYGIWHSDEVLAMVEWMRAWNADPAHRTKVKVYGVDVQSPANAAAAVLAYLGQVDPEEARRADAYVGAIAAARATTYARSPAPARATLREGLTGLLARFDAHRDDWSRQTSGREWLIARQHARLLVQHEEMLAPLAGESSYDARDKGMDENVAWVVEQAEPGARAVFWAHNGHISRAGYDGVISVGERLAARYGKAYVTFGFVFNQGGFRASGPTGWVPHEVPPEPPGGLGATFAAAGPPRFALDLRAVPPGAARAWLETLHLTRDIGALFTTERNTESVFRIAHQFDVIFFIDTTHPATSL